MKHTTRREPHEDPRSKDVLLRGFKDRIGKDVDEHVLHRNSRLGVCEIGTSGPEPPD
jgi:hypothetical protein